MMVLDAVAKGAKTAEAVTAALARTTYQGVAMTYKSDGKGNMAHSEVIVCYDGSSRVPKVVKRYDNLDGAL
jgi:branched-chain amino acid transport system substrate-binding protein